MVTNVSFVIRDVSYITYTMFTTIKHICESSRTQQVSEARLEFCDNVNRRNTDKEGRKRNVGRV